MTKYFNLGFPTKKKWLKNYWQRNINTFLYAIENPEIQEAIRKYREIWLTNEIGRTPEELEPILKRIFLKEAESGRDLDNLTWDGNKVVKEDGEYYVIAKRGKDGYTKVPLGSTLQESTKWHLSNPFYIFNDDQILKPEWKLRLTKMLANPKENSWLFEPRFAINEAIIVHPSSHMGIMTLHELSFLRPLDMHVLGRLNLDYFVFWPMFFYYALTDDMDYIIENVGFLTYPVKVFLVEDGEHKNLVFRFYGDCNFNEIQKFISENKVNFEKLTKLLGNPSVTGSGMKDFYMYKTRQVSGDSLIAFSELGKRNVIKLPKKKPEQMSYKDYLAKNVVQDLGGLIGSKKLVKKQNKKELARINVAYSQVKKEIGNLTKYDKWKALEEAKKLVDEINKPKL